MRAGDSALDRLAGGGGPIAVSPDYQNNVLRMPMDPAIARVIGERRGG